MSFPQLLQTPGAVHFSFGGRLCPRFAPLLSLTALLYVLAALAQAQTPSCQMLYQPFAAISSDGGQTFGANVVLNEGFSDPTRGGEGGGWIGDYTGNTWAGPNYFIAAWMDNSQTPNMEDVVGGVRLK